VIAGPTLRTAPIAALVLAWLLSVVPSAHATGYERLIPTDQADSRVWAIVHIGGVAYIGGEFTHITDHQGGTVARNRLAAIDVDTGKVNGWNPGADGPVFALATDGTRIFVGGNFRSLGGKPADRLGAVNLSGNRVESWRGRAGFEVRDLAVHGNTLYVGGAFARLNGVPRANLGALSTADGHLRGFDPQVGGPGGNTIRSLAVSPGGGRVFLGGYFEKINGASHYHMGAVDAETGATEPWRWHPPNSAYPEDMQVNDTGVFVGFAAKGTDFHGMGSFTRDRGKARWTLRTCGDVQDIALREGVMYIAGHLRCIKNIDEHPREGLGAMSFNGRILSWAPTANIGCSRGCLGPWELQFCGNLLCVGGDFSRVNGVLQSKFAVLR
jgi:hypothetical protein